jgi:hypothetical protein
MIVRDTGTRSGSGKQRQPADRMQSARPLWRGTAHVSLRNRGLAV